MEIAFVKPKRVSVNLLWLNTAFSVFYWVMESVRDAFVFGKGNVIERIFVPDPMSFWMRMLVIFIFALFTALSFSLRESIEFKKIKLPKAADAFGILWIGAGFGVLYWILEAVRDVVVFSRGNLLQRIFMPDAMGFWMRGMVVFTLFLFSAYAQAVVNRHRKTENDLKKAYDEMEQQVREKTMALTRSNEMLMQQIGMRTKTETVKQITNRMFNMLSACNEILNRTGRGKDLLDEICGTIASMGNYPVVWMDAAEPNDGTTIHPESKYASNPWDAMLTDSTEEYFADGQNPIGQTLRSGKTHVIQFDSIRGESKPWVLEAVKCGYASLISLPMRTNGNLFGVLSIYTTDSSAFDPDTVAMLEKLSDQIGLGIAKFRPAQEK